MVEVEGFAARIDGKAVVIAPGALRHEGRTYAHKGVAFAICGHWSSVDFFFIHAVVRSECYLIRSQVDAFDRDLLPVWLKIAHVTLSPALAVADLRPLPPPQLPRLHEEITLEEWRRKIAAMRAGPPPPRA